MTTLTRFGTYNAVLPRNGPKVYPMKLDFRVANSIVIDMAPEIEGGFIDFISGVIIDNRLNANPIEITVASIGQSVGIPAGKQSQMPLCVGDAAQLTFATNAANNLLIPVLICNFPMWPIIF